ncbi:hypothetical protein CLOM_g17220 [Closterium sp. NIES-68]|nr:hypothetical protein CLOM_g17220 [Closterium sp. NIES-68]GJP67257.1 hypothetical protein CLOP_g24099 [Closterium sp. NIES-67]
MPNCRSTRYCATRRENFCRGLSTKLFILSWTSPTFMDTTSKFCFSCGLRQYFRGLPAYFHGHTHIRS